jgi:hypothetical protein
LSHEEWVDAGWYEFMFGAPPPANPARDTGSRRQLVARDYVSRSIGVRDVRLAATAQRS